MFIFLFSSIFRVYTLCRSFFTLFLVSSSWPFFASDRRNKVRKGTGLEPTQTHIHKQKTCNDNDEFFCSFFNDERKIKTYVNELYHKNFTADRRVSAPACIASNHVKTSLFFTSDL